MNEIKPGEIHISVWISAALAVIGIAWFLGGAPGDNKWDASVGRVERVLARVLAIALLLGALIAVGYVAMRFFDVH